MTGFSCGRCASITLFHRRHRSSGGNLLSDILKLCKVAKFISAHSFVLISQIQLLAIHILTMSTTRNQSSQTSESYARGAGTTFRPDDTKPSSTATPGFSEGSATAAGHGDHPKDHADISNVTMPRSRIGPQNEDLEGEKMAPPGDGKVMAAQLRKKDAGWGEEGSLTSNLDRQKAEQQNDRERIINERMSGTIVDGAGRMEDEDMDAV